MKRILTIVVAFAMLITVASALGATVAAQSLAWDGSYGDKFAGGDGTSENPYLISNGVELSLIESMTNYEDNDCAGLHFKLIDDINLGGQEWYPIGEGVGFKGIFDGNGKTIYNAIIKSGKYTALFGRIDGGTVKDLKLDYITVEGYQIYAAALSAQANNGCTVENIEIGENVTVTNSNTCDPNALVGGCVSMAISNGSVFKNIRTSAKIIVNNSVASSIYAGGVFAACGGSAHFENVIFDGEIVCDNDNAKGASALIGGICGSAGAKKLDFTMKNAINYGSIKGSGKHFIAGGIVGFASSDVTSADVCGNFENVYNASADISAPNGAGFFVGKLAMPLILTGNNKFISGGSYKGFAGVTLLGLTAPDASTYMTATSDADFVIDRNVLAIVDAVSAALPTWNEVTLTDPEPPVDSTPTETDPIIPEDTDPVTPEDTAPVTPTETEPQTPVETNPQTPAQTQKPSAGTEKPTDEGGCGSVIASGLAIFAVVSLAGSVLTKKK